MTMFEYLLSNPLLSLGIFSVFYWGVLSHFNGEAYKLRRIPTVFSNVPFISSLQTWFYFFRMHRLVDDSFRKWPTTVFRIPEALRWTVVVSDRRMVEELFRSADTTMSSAAANFELVQMRHTLGSDILGTPYHIPVLSNTLRRSLPHLVPQLYEELINAYETFIPFTKDWAPIKCSEVVPRIVSQVSNRILVGYPLCRDPGFMDLSTQYTFDVFTVSFILRWVPVFLRPLVNILISNVPKQKRKALGHLGPLIDARRKEREKADNQVHQPMDMLTWLMDAAKDEQTTNEALTNRLLAINFGSIHTTSLTFLHALYYLAASPEYTTLLREEVDVVIFEHGWTKAGIDEMKRLDSFFRETQRIKPLANVGLGWVALKDHTFSDGTFIPKGTTVSINVNGPHFDGAVYEDPYTFDPLRFVKMQERTGRSLDMTSTSSEFIFFGHGRHACPGRYFAASELKLMLAYILTYYDVKFSEEGKRPDDLWLSTSCLPNMKAHVLFRKREM